MISKKTNVHVGSQRTRNRKRYQRLVPEVDISCSPKSIIGRKKKANNQTDSRCAVNHLNCLIIFLISFRLLILLISGVLWINLEGVYSLIGPFFCREN